MTTFAKALTAASFAIVLSIATLGTTTSAEAFPIKFSGKSVSTMDLGSGR